MGRWLNRIHKSTDNEPSKPTKPSFESFERGREKYLAKQMPIINQGQNEQSSNNATNPKFHYLIKFVEGCCVGLDTHAQEVLTNFLSHHDMHEMVNGEVTEDNLKLHIQVWIDEGKQYYSGH